jgi:hypothetical protein
VERITFRFSFFFFSERVLLQWQFAVI